MFLIVSTPIHTLVFAVGNANGAHAVLSLETNLKSIIVYDYIVLFVVVYTSRLWHIQVFTLLR